MLLVHLLRENLNLTGIHIGCDTRQCGACVVHIDGRALCTVLAGQASGFSVTTIEGEWSCSGREALMAKTSMQVSDFDVIECNGTRGTGLS